MALCGRLHDLTCKILKISKEHLQSLQDSLAQLNIGSELYSNTETWRQPVLILDQIGILAELYTWGTAAFVGGSFKKQVHSVMEPLAAGLPVVTTGQGSSGLKVINGEHYLGSEHPQELTQLLNTALSDPALLQRIGEAGRAYVRAEHDWAVAAAQLEQVYTRLPSLKEEVSVCA